MLVIGAYQTLEIGGVITLIGMGAFLSHGALVGLNDLSPLAFRLVIAIGVGLIAALLAVILSTDLVPDWWEFFGRRALLVALAVGAVLVVRRLVR
jgi:hypothetical protein